MKIYCYGEHTTKKGEVCRNEELIESESDDISLWGEGERDDLIAQAIQSLGTRYDHRAGGAGDSFRWKCDLSVLEYLDGPKMKFDDEKMAYVVTPRLVRVVGSGIQCDRSGIGNCWVDATEDDCPANIQEEIAAEILDGGHEVSECFRASNGVWYRW